MQGPGFILAIGLAIIHSFLSKLNISLVIPEHRWISFAGAIMVGAIIVCTYFFENLALSS